MAGDWIKMRCDLAEDPAVIAIAAKVGRDEFDIVGRLHTVWSWADRQSRDGHAAGVTHAFLDRKVRCEGFAQAMCDVGWLELDLAGVTFPNFDRHNGKTAKERALSTRRQQSRRGDVPENVTDEAGQTSRPQRDKGVTREEKRREEEKKGVPDWVDAKAWSDFVAHRKKKRAPMTERAIELLVEKLGEYRRAGISPTTVLNFAIEQGHTGLYYKRGIGHGQPLPASHAGTLGAEETS